MAYGCKPGSSAMGKSAKSGGITAFGRTPSSREGGLRNTAPSKPAQRVGIGLKNPKGLK